MKSPATLLMMSLLVTGCANFPGGTSTDDSTASTAQPEQSEVREREVQFGNWRVDCIYEEVNYLTQCKAETYGKITEFHGDEMYHPTPVLWISCMKIPSLISCEAIWVFKLTTSACPLGSEKMASPYFFEYRFLATPSSVSKSVRAMSHPPTDAI